MKCGGGWLHTHAHGVSNQGMTEHTHSHSHSHAHGSGKGLGIALGLTLAFAFVEAVAGWWANSLALLSDAGHMLTDSMALGLATVAAWLSGRGPSPRHSYGLGRAELLSAMVNAVLMLGVATAIVAAAIGRLQAPPVEIRGAALTVVALLGFGINLLAAWLLARERRNINVRAALIHVMSDLLGSVAAFVSGIVILTTGWTPIDAVLSFVIVALILYSSLSLLREAVHGLMEGVPFDISMEEVGHAIVEEEGVVSVHDLHIWSLSSQRVALSAHIVTARLDGWADLLLRLQTMLAQRFGIEHVTLQPESVEQPVHFYRRRSDRFLRSRLGG